MFRKEPLENARERMVDEQLSARNIVDARVLEAMRKVPRHAFVPADLLAAAYEDRPLAIGQGQTISQPYIVALMAEVLQLGPTSRVLEIGTGSGYSAAILAELGREVISLERHAELATRARLILAHLGLSQVHVHITDGSVGWPNEAPYDAISVTASGPFVPHELRNQLAVGGRLVIPVGDTVASQNLLLIERKGPVEFVETTVCPVRFVPLVGARGWSDEASGMR
ncbi:MAG TPA: protein-L-isoaspartate(D-aspartate) O-methyltransferase [Polyangium sp.]|nr:protein-L-isoaspartate(D-aspartate) O-methyltransferase [Polyangium sp.]